MSSIRMRDKWYKELVMRLPQMTTGKIFYVDKNTGSDSDSGRYQFAPKATIQSAVDAVTDGRGDVVLIGAGIYYENVRITKSKMTLMGAQTGGKESVSIRPAGVGIAGATTAEASPLYGYTALSGAAIRGAAVTINAASVELVGLQFDGSGMRFLAGDNWYHYVGVYVGDGTRISSSYNYDCNGSYIHDCIFKRGGMGINYDGASEDHRLEHNLFYRQEADTNHGGVFIDPGSSRQTSRILIADNVFMALESTSYGIFGYNSNDTKAVMVLRNAFVERAGYSMTYAVYYAGTGDWLVAGNWFGCTNEIYLNAASWSCGNYEGVAGAGPVTLFVTEA